MGDPLLCATETNPFGSCFFLIVMLQEVGLGSHGPRIQSLYAIIGGLAR